MRQIKCSTATATGLEKSRGKGDRSLECRAEDQKK